MKMRNKGKVYPSPSSSSVPSLSPNGDALSVWKLLPAAILALASALSIEEREVLAYMITRSMTSANPASIVEEKKKSPKKPSAHKPPLFHCDCFDCYTIYWFRWDSSPNRELIHQAIEAFEEHLATGEQSQKNSRPKPRPKKKDKACRRLAGTPPPEKEADVLPGSENAHAVVSQDDDASPPPASAEKPEEVVEAAVDHSQGEDSTAEEVAAMVLRCSAVSNHRGMARKVLPDVLGLFDSRLWSLWSPNV